MFDNTYAELKRLARPLRIVASPITFAFSGRITFPRVDGPNRADVRSGLLSVTITFTEELRLALITKTRQESRTPTDSDRARPQFHIVARAVRPRFPQSAGTMSKCKLQPGKSTDYDQLADILGVVR